MEKCLVLIFCSKSREQNQEGLRKLRQHCPMIKSEISTVMIEEEADNAVRAFIREEAEKDRSISYMFFHHPDRKLELIKALEKAAAEDIVIVDMEKLAALDTLENLMTMLEDNEADGCVIQGLNKTRGLRQAAQETPAIELWSKDEIIAQDYALGMFKSRVRDDFRLNFQFILNEIFHPAAYRILRIPQTAHQPLESTNKSRRKLRKVRLRNWTLVFLLISLFFVLGSCLGFVTVFIEEQGKINPDAMNDLKELILSSAVILSAQLIILGFGINQGIQMVRKYREFEAEVDEIHEGRSPEAEPAATDLLEFTSRKLNTRISELRYCPDYREMALSYLGAFSEKQQYSLLEWSKTLSYITTDSVTFKDYQALEAYLNLHG